MRTKILTLLLCSLGIWISAQAQISKHAITVKRYSDWGKGYLTIAEQNALIDGKPRTWKYIAADSIRISQDFGPIYREVAIYKGLVLEVNGIDAKDMSETRFYNIVDNTDDITMKIWQDCTKDPVNVKLVKMPYPEEFLDLDITLDDIINTTDDVSFGRSVTSNFAYQEKMAKEVDATINQLSDSDFDWFYVKTYDFLITGNDPLTDKKILENLYLPLHWKRDTENPDILITIAKNADESISSTYVPPSSRTINTGSLTTSQYNYLTKRNEYTTQQYNTTIREGGYTQTTKSINIFLELTVLDTKRLDEQTPPIIWQMTFRRYVVNPTFDVLAEYQNIARGALLPLSDRCGITTIEHYHYRGMKLIRGSNQTTRVSSVKEGSYAYNMGFRKGDIIVKYNYFNHRNVRSKSGLGYYNYSNENICNKPIDVFVKRGGKTIKLHGTPLTKSPKLEFIHLIDKP